MNKKEIDLYLKQLFPLNRSLTGDNNRKSLKLLKQIIDIKIKEIPTGKKVYDWTIPKEWNVTDAYIKDKYGEKLISFTKNNLHLVGYSVPVNKKMNWSQLRKKLHYSNKRKSSIPYRTSYYHEDWGFCLKKKQYEQIRDSEGPFKVVIESSLKKGNLTYGEYFKKGRSKREILISTYICHPSMANDCLSGMIVTSFLAREIKKIKTKWSYRFVFIPETIGAIAYCNLNEKKLKKIDAGLVITTVGGKGLYGYKQSWDRNHQINSDIEKTLSSLNIKFKTYPFSIRGSDERQYSSQGFKINTASITKDKYFEYKEYHTSADNLKFVKSENIALSIKIYKALIKEIEKWEIFETKMKNCEYMLSRRNLYPKIGGSYKATKNEYTMSDLIQWILFMSDGKKNIEKISSDIGIEMTKVRRISKLLVKKKLLKEI